MPQISDQQWEDLRCQIDSLENNVTTLTLMTAVPDKTHVDALRGNLPKIVNKMQAIVAEVDGDDEA